MTRLQPILHKHRSLLLHVVFAVTAIVAVGLVADSRDRFGYVLGVVLATVAVMTVPLSESESERLGTCWFCKTEVPYDALIAGYDTFEEQRLACLACDERIQRKQAA